MNSYNDWRNSDIKSRLNPARTPRDRYFHGSPRLGRLGLLDPPLLVRSPDITPLVDSGVVARRGPIIQGLAAVRVEDLVIAVGELDERPLLAESSVQVILRVCSKRGSRT